MWNIPHKDATKGESDQGNSHRAEQRHSIQKEESQIPTCEGLGMKCKMARQSTSIRDKDVLALGAPITDKAHTAEMETLFKSKMSEIKMNQKQNLFNPTREYIMGNSPI